MPETRTDVIISGAGPNGLMLACELALAGVQPVVLEKLSGPTNEQRANGIIGQAVRLLDMRGLYREGHSPDLLGSGERPTPLPRFIFSGMGLDFTQLSANPMYGMGIAQPTFVRLLVGRAEELGVDIRWGHALADLHDHGEAVTVAVAGPDGPYEVAAR